jgi:hypothetical protein
MLGGYRSRGNGQNVHIVHKSEPPPRAATAAFRTPGIEGGGQPVAARISV